MFRFTRKPSSRSHSQYLAEITHLVKSRYAEAVHDFFSVMAVFCSHNTENVMYSLHVSTFNQVCNFS